VHPNSTFECDTTSTAASCHNTFVDYNPYSDNNYTWHYVHNDSYGDAYYYDDSYNWDDSYDYDNYDWGDSNFQDNYMNNWTYVDDNYDYDNYDYGYNDGNYGQYTPGYTKDCIYNYYERWWYHGDEYSLDQKT